MKLGVPWTSKGKKSPRRPASHNDADDASLHARLDDLARQLERLSQITGHQALHGGPAAASQVPPHYQGTIPPHRPDPRYQPAARPDAPPTPDVSRYAGARTLNRAPLRPVYSQATLDQAMAEIAARQRALDGAERSLHHRAAVFSEPPPPPPPPEPPPPAPEPPPPPAQDLSGLEAQLRQITSQIETLRRPCAAEESVPSLRQELSDISRALAEAAPRRAIESLEADVRGLAQRLDQSRQSGIDQSAVTNLEHGLAEVRDAVRALRPAESLVGFQAAIQGVSDKIDTIVTNRQDPALLKQLVAAITSLHDIVANVASEAALTRLTDEVRALASRIEHTVSAAPNQNVLANIDRQIGAIAKAIAQTPAPDTQAPARLEAMVRDLGQRIEGLQLSRGDTIAFGQLEERIAKLVERLDTSGTRFNHLEAIERGLGDVLVHLEEQGARAGALRAADADPSVASLKQGLEGLNTSLGRLFDRLAAIESRFQSSVQQPVARAAAPAAAAAVPAEPPASKTPAAPPVTPAAAGAPAAAAAPAKPQAAPASPSREPATAQTAAAEPKAPAAAASPASVAPPASTETEPAATAALPSERLAAAFKAQRPATPRERPPIDPTLPPDHPLEPGAATGKAGSSPAERIAASEAALGAVRPAGNPGAEGNADFIAAARRAAQAASQLPDDSAAGSGAADEANASSGGRFGDRVKSVLVGASVVVLAAGAAHVAIPLIEPYLTTAPDSVQSAKAPEILPVQKSAERLAPAPIITGSTGQLWNVPEHVITSGAAPIAPPAAETADEAKTEDRNEASTETETTGDNNADTPARDAQAHVQGHTDVTGALPAEQPSAGEAKAVPVPPTRPGEGKIATLPKSPLTVAAEAGNPRAAYELAVRYIEGRGVTRSYEEAARWLAISSKEGIAPAQFRLGSLYEKGLGVKKDLNAARRLYAAAAEKGNAKAMHNLAVLYAEGIDGKPNYEVAVEWFRKAADRNVADSQYNLAVLYARGVGLEQNLAESYKWFALAALRGDQEAGRKRDDIAGRLDKDSLMAARLAVKTWIPKQQPQEAMTVAAPPGGWDQATPAPAAKRRARDAAPKKAGPG